MKMNAKVYIEGKKITSISQNQIKERFTTKEKY